MEHRLVAGSTPACPIMARRRIQAGQLAAKIGNDFEKALERAHAAYHESGLAMITKLPVPTVPVGPRARVLAERQHYDYVGFFGPRAGPEGHGEKWYGRAVAMEAKCSNEEKPSLPIVPAGKKGGSGIKEHQLRALADHALNFGVASCVVWLNGARPLMLSPGAVLDAWWDYIDGTRKSIPASRFTGFMVAAWPGHGEVVDWLYPLRIWLAEQRIGDEQSAWSGAMAVRWKIDYKTAEIHYGFSLEERGHTVQFPLAITDETFEIIRSIAKSSSSDDEFRQQIEALAPANEAG